MSLPRGPVTHLQVNSRSEGCTASVSTLPVLEEGELYGKVVMCFVLPFGWGKKTIYHHHMCSYGHPVFLERRPQEPGLFACLWGRWVLGQGREENSHFILEEAEKHRWLPGAEPDAGTVGQGTCFVTDPEGGQM